MTDWTGDGSTIVVPPSAGAAPCITYISVDDVRAEYGDDVAELTDEQIQRKIDHLVSFLEEQIGHGFGRAAVARSTSATDTVAVTATSLVIGGHTFTFAAYATLGLLAAAVNASGHAFSLELLPHVDPSTPSDLLAVRSAATCGDDYEDRVHLCLSALWVRLTGKCESHLFLPLPLQTVSTVTEDGTALDALAYWAVAGESWLVRKLCDCDTSACTTCSHATGHWAGTYPGNIQVEYTPLWWGHPPASLGAALMEAFGAQSGVGDGALESETFGTYSYRRSAGKASSWQELLGGSSVRQYGIKFAP